MRKMRPIALAALGGSLSLLLTGCIPEPPPVLPEQTSLSFTYPELPKDEQFSLSALYYTTEADGSTVAHMLRSSPASGAQSQFWLPDYQLDKLAADPKCTTPFLAGEAKGRQDVSVTPNTAKTCNIYFILHRGNGYSQPSGWVPTESDVLYQSHSLFGYASENFSYSMRDAANKSTETGQRRQGWSLVRHEVLQPEAMPGQYLVTMNSVPEAEETLPIRLHEKTNFFTSMSLGGGQP